jgi:hypothetical protein
VAVSAAGDDIKNNQESGFPGSLENETRRSWPGSRVSLQEMEFTIRTRVQRSGVYYLKSESMLKFGGDPDPMTY